jgi:hypothetical protein
MQSLTCLLQNRRTSPLPQSSIDPIFSDAQFMDELSFFGFNGNPAPLTDDLLDTASPPELSQVESI